MSGKKVLVVDDEIHIVHVVAIKLRNNGYEVISAADGLAGLETAREQRPDIIVTDLQMPVMTGLEMVTKLRADESTKHIPVIMLTAREFDVEPEQREQLHIAECVSKPFSPRELLRSIEDVLSLQPAAH